MLRSNIILSGLFLVMLAGPRAAMAAEIQNIKPNSAVAGEDAPVCHNKFGIKGHPHKLDTIARLSAVSAWTEMAIKYGEEYTMWHNAKGKSIKCKKLPRSEFLLCFAKGRPCRAIITGKTAENKTN
jgi:hypothetical protein